MLSIDYYPYYQHPVKRTMTIFIGCISIFSVLMGFNHLSTYGGLPPVEFFVFPLALLASAFYRCQIGLGQDGSIKLTWGFAGFVLSRKEAEAFTMDSEGKSYRLFLKRAGESNPTSILLSSQSTAASLLKG